MSTATVLRQTPDLALFPQRYIDNAMLWDCRPDCPFIYLMCPAHYPDPHYMLKFNRETMTMVLQVAETHDEWSSFGVPDMDLQGRIYWTAPGGQTYAFQKLGRFSADTLSLLDYALTGSTHIRVVSGTFRVDRRSPHQLWWHRENSDLTHGRLTCYRQSDMQLVYTVPRETFGIEPDFFSGDRDVSDVDSDADGVLWAIQDWKGKPGGGEHRLFKILPDGTTTMVLDLSVVVQELFGGAGMITANGDGLKWIAADNTLVAHIPPFLVKISCAALTVVGTLNIGIRKGQQSFHHTADDTRPLVWVGSFYEDLTIAVPPRTDATFPELVEVDLRSLVITRTERCPEIGAFYPFIMYSPPGDFNRYAELRCALYDPATGCVTTDDGSFAVICHYCFGTEEPSVPKLIPLCPPVGTMLETTHTKSVLFPTELL